MKSLKLAQIKQNFPKYLIFLLCMNISSTIYELFITPSKLPVRMSLFDVIKLHFVEINTVFFTISPNDNAI